MKQDTKKCVMVLDEKLPVGLMVNTAGVLAITLGRNAEDMVGPEVADGSGLRHAGITKVPVPILKADKQTVRDIRLRAEDAEGLLAVDFTDAAQAAKTYDEYENKVNIVSSGRLEYLGVALYGDKKEINKLTGSLPLLK